MSAFSGNHGSSGMAVASSNAGLEKEGAVLGDCLASADSDTHHCNLADTTQLCLHAHKDIRLLSPPGTPTLSGAKFKGKTPWI